jgi:hypothetical protein
MGRPPHPEHGWCYPIGWGPRRNKNEKKEKASMCRHSFSLVLPGCHDLRCSALSYLPHYDGLKSLKPWAKMNHSSLKLFWSGIFSQWWMGCPEVERCARWFHKFWTSKVEPKEQGVVVLVCNPSYSGGKSRKIAVWGQDGPKAQDLI